MRQWPIAMKSMLQRFRLRVWPDRRKKLQICVLVFATDRDTAVAAIEAQLQTWRENRFGHGGSASTNHNLSYAIEETEG